MNAALEKLVIEALQRIANGSYAVTSVSDYINQMKDTAREALYYCRFAESEAAKKGKKP